MERLAMHNGSGGGCGGEKEGPDGTSTAAWLRLLQPIPLDPSENGPIAGQCKACPNASLDPSLKKSVSQVWASIARCTDLNQEEETDTEAQRGSAEAIEGQRRVRPCRRAMPVPPETNLRFFLLRERELEEGYSPNTRLHGRQEGTGERGEGIPCAKRAAWPSGVAPAGPGPG